MNAQVHRYVHDKLDRQAEQVAEARTRVNELELELETTRRGALTVMPKEAVAIASAFWGLTTQSHPHTQAARV